MGTKLSFSLGALTCVRRLLFFLLRASAATGIAAAISISASAQPDEADPLDYKSDVLSRAGKYVDAVPLAQRALAIREKKFGPNHPYVAFSLTNLGILYWKLGRLAEAEPLYKRALAIRQTAFGPDNRNVAASLNNLANLYGDRGRYTDAEPLYRRAVAIEEAALGPDDPDLAIFLNNLASVYQRQSRYADAEPLYKRSLAIGEKAFGSDSLDIALALTNLANLYEDQGRYSEVEPLYKRALAIREKTLGLDHPDIASSLNFLANHYERLGRYADAEPLYKRSLAIREKVLGLDHPDVGVSLTSLAILYGNQARYADAEPLYKRALAIQEKTLGPDSVNVASSLNGLANLYQLTGRTSEAVALYKRSLAIWQKAFGPDHPDVAISLDNLADVYSDQHYFADAEALYKRSLAIREKSLGPDHPDVAQTLNNLALLYDREGQYGSAESLYKRSLAIRQRLLGSSHPQVAVSLNNIALFYGNQKRFADAIPFLEQAIASGQTHPSIALPILLGASEQSSIGAQKAGDDALSIVQRGNQTSVAAAVGKLAVRLAAGNDRLAQLVRRDQDLNADAESLDQAIVTAVAKEPSKRDAAAEQRLRDRLAAIFNERAALQKTFAVEFPEFAALSNPLPLTTERIQLLLSDDEALVVFSVGDGSESFVFAITRDRFEWTALPLNGEGLSKLVADFRRGLDVNKIASGRSGWFDLERANTLYTSLFGPIESIIKDKKQLLVVPSGTLSALPFHLLVTEKPTAAVPDNIVGYRDAAWLINRQAVTVLPSIASLQVSRTFGRKKSGGKPLVGFGDPIFDPSAAPVPGSRAVSKVSARTLTTYEYSDFWQGAAIDRDKLTQALPELPDTAIELTLIAKKLGALSEDIHFGRDASETTAKRLPLADYRIVYFATHALVAGDIKGVAEPSLVLSIPLRPTELDDGLLTASEVARLKLNADWVVLSACNTIAGEKPGAEALSGLARSFFYAGAKALLVSHWAVSSEAATRLTTSTFDRLTSDRKLGRAEALRQAMLSYLNDQSEPENAYPALWGPFALIGEGGG